MKNPRILALITSFVLVSSSMMICSSYAQSAATRQYSINFYVFMGKSLGAMSPEFAAYDFSYKIDRIVVNNNAGNSGVGPTSPGGFIKTNGIISGEITGGSELWITIRLKGGGQVVKEESFHVPVPTGRGIYELKSYFLKDENYTVVTEDNFNYYKRNGYKF